MLAALIDSQEVLRPSTHLANRSYNIDIRYQYPCLSELGIEIVNHN